jgi:uncharacterized SAM-binding protein YcdF (DUF218 family)
MKYIRIHVVVCSVFCLLLFLFSLRFLNRSLIVDNPAPSDVILVPSGDFALRSGQALHLAEAGFGSRLLVDEGSESLTYGRSLAARRAEQLSGSAVQVSICPIRSDSTSSESHEAAGCVQSLHAKSVLIVTSDFHTKRALSVFRAAMPGIAFSVASAPTSYGKDPWWSVPSLATSLEEWAAISWWRVTER